MSIFDAIVSLTIGIISAFTINGAFAAEFKVDTYEDGTTYVYMEGKTIAADRVRLNNALELARNSTYQEEVCNFVEETLDSGAIATTEVCETETFTRTFSKDIYLTGPGGDARAGFDMGITIRKNGLNTIAWKDCISACSAMWLGGVDRAISEQVPSRVGFHFAFVPDGARAFERTKDNLGWVGVQDVISKGAAYSLAQDLFFGIAKPELFVFKMIGSGSQQLFWIDNENLHIIGQKPKRVAFE